MAATRELRGRINSVSSSQKITGAMKMISSARLRKEENALLSAKPFKEQLDKLLRHVTGSVYEYQSPLGVDREIRSVAILLLASNEGLCGAFNVILYKKFIETVEEYRQQGVRNIMVYLVGNKLQGNIRKTAGIMQMPIPDAFTRKEYAAGCVELADKLIGDFLSGAVDRVDIVYFHYKSVSSQTVQRECLLPWVYGEKEDVDSCVVADTYIYEPDAKTILDVLYPLAIHSSVYRALLENRTSEQAARVFAMQMANDNADKLLQELRLQYNRLRQQAITSELLDIVGGSLK